MRNDYQHQQERQQRPLLLSSASIMCFITLMKAVLLLNALLPLAHAADAGPITSNNSCYNAPSIPPCPMFHNMTAFPFLTSPACGSTSSFTIVGCDSEANISKPPTWPNFVNATIPANMHAPFLMDFFTPFSLNSSKFSAHLVNSSNGDVPNRQNVGFINLTWSPPLTNKPNICESLLSADEIFDYIPQSINLSHFAKSVFEFSASNIILLFDCKSSLSADQHLQKNSPHCRSFAQACGNASSMCYQYTPPRRKELNLLEATNSLDCKKAIFFVSSRIVNVSASEWKPGLIQLNWSTIDSVWMNETLKSCEGCMKRKGVCGYDPSDNFRCHCADKKDSDAFCEATISTSSNRFKRIGLKIAYGAAGFAIALFLGLTLFCIWKRMVFMKSSASSPHNNNFWMKKPSFLWRKQDPILAKEMSYHEIVHATESFAEKHMLGDGGFGTVYKGVLADGRKVAVKRLYHDNYRRMEHFFNEIKVLSNLNHPNLVKLYGFSYEDEKELLLIFEYAPRGTVSDQLHNASRPPMSWKLRLDIACETAEALSYLHNSVSPPIYHRDVKTTNILLDEGFHAKLADFGLSKLVPLSVTHVSTAPQGTPGYLDPEYHQCYQLTDKSDVYSLGVVLMELVSAKLAVDMSRERGEINLSTLAIIKIQCGKSEELVDPRLEMKKNPYVERSINRVLEVAFQCLHAEREERPSMSSVAETLAKIRRDYVDDDVEAHPNIHINTHGTPTIYQSCVSNGLNKPFVDSPCSVYISSRSSNLSSTLSSC